MGDRSITASGRDLYLAWTQYQRRQDSMAAQAGFECVFFQRSSRRGLPATVIDYARLSVRTWRLLRQRRPRVLWLQLPTVALLWVALSARRLMLPDMKIVADCHNAMFRPPWSRVPAGVSWLGRCDAVIVHNDAVLGDALALGLPAERTCVLEDVPPTALAEPAHAPLPIPSGLQRPWVLLPGSFSADEPVAEVLATAAEMPEATFIITGRTERAARCGHDLSHAPPNVVMPGYLELPAFERLMRSADLVLGLTRHEGIQLSVCNEALGFGKPMVVSDTRILRELFSSACELTPGHDPQTLVAAIRRALERRDELATRSRRLAGARVQTWRESQYAAVQAVLGAHGAGSGRS